MNCAALIGLEERERIDRLRARGREIGFVYMMRSVLSEKMEGVKEERSNWERTIDRPPGAPRGWDAISDRGKQALAIIFAETERENQAREKAAALEAKKVARRLRRRQQTRTRRRR